MTADNRELEELATALRKDLDESRSRLISGEIFHAQHGDFAERAWSMGTYLRAALDLVSTALYPQAFVVLRSAMEHHAVDHLLFLGNRYIRLVKGVSEETLAHWRRQLAQGELASDILSIERALRGNDVVIVRSGVHFKDQGLGLDAPSLSRYYGVMESHDPFTIHRPGVYDHIGDWPYREEHRAQHVERQRTFWREDLSWSALVAGMFLNNFYTSAECARWHVHYGFLCAFAHPTSPRAIAAVYGRNSPGVHQDHFAAELALLYILTLARLELEVFDEMATRAPTVGLQGREEIRVRAGHARALASYFWFPTGAPEPFDRVQEANHRGMTPDLKIVPRDERRPEDLVDDEVRYYENPLKRNRLTRARRSGPRAPGSPRPGSGPLPHDVVLNRHPFPNLGCGRRCRACG
jgi:hypothetical protein